MYTGIYGFVIASIQFCFIDLHGVINAYWSIDSLLFLGGFVLCICSMYINTAYMLSCQDGDSVLFNLSLLTSDIYAVLFSYIFYGTIVHWLYFLAFSLVCLGILTYHSESAPTSNFVSKETLQRNEESTNYSPVVMRENENIGDGTTRIN